MYTVLKEITQWDKVDCHIPNHTYYLNDKEQMIAYKREGEEEIDILSKPHNFYKSYRKFKKLPSVESL